MRALYVPVRLAATVMTVAVGAGCVSVGDDGAKPGPSHSARQRGGEEPDGGPAGPDGAGAEYQGGRGKKGAVAEPHASASASKSASASASGTAKPSPGPTTKDGEGGDHEDKPPRPEPPQDEPTPTRTQEQPPPTKEPEPPAPEPPTAEPSSSAHDQGTQLVEREPAPRAGEAAA